MPTADEFNAWSAETIMGATLVKDNSGPGYTEYWEIPPGEFLGSTHQYRYVVKPEWTPYTDRKQMAMVLERVQDAKIKDAICSMLLPPMNQPDRVYALLTAPPQQIAEAVWRAWHEQSH